LPTDANPLIYNDYRPIPGRSLLVFLGVCVVALTALRLLGPLLHLEFGLLGASGLFFMIALAAVVIAVRPIGWAAIPALGLRPAPWKYAVFGALATLALSVAVSQLGLEPKDMKDVLEKVREPHQLVLSLLLFAVLAPIVEELVFRGLLYGWVAGRWGSVAAWIVSSLVFAGAHWDPAHAILVLPLGFLFGWLRRRTDSLLPSLCAHIVNNGFALVAAVYLPDV